ncbi:MAG: hypothetical protein K0R80_2445 [Clostridia bacterium]|nr:hypothetical protein [Clostridia bacterium]
MDSINLAKNKLPLSIREKETIAKYSSEYIRAKRLIQKHKYFNNLSTNNSNLHIQEILLLVTFACTLEKNTRNTSFDNQVSLYNESAFDSDQGQSYTLWNAILHLFFNPIKQHYLNKHINMICHPHFAPLPNDLVIDLYRILQPLCSNPLFISLVPYILECFEYEDTKKNKDSTALLDEKKKLHGIYYTPDDVVTYIVDNTVSSQIENLKILNSSENIPESQLTNNLKVIDTSCGTGVFLIKSIARIVEEYRSLISSQTYSSNIKCPLALSIANNIYGIDKSKTAVVSCIFLIIITNIEILLESDFSPYQIYLLALLNIRCGDAITSTDITMQGFTERENIITTASLYRVSMKEQIFSNMISGIEERIGSTPSVDSYNPNFGFWFQYEFPEVFLMNDGFSCIIGNPPYAKASEGNLLIEQTHSYAAAANMISSNIYTYFVENMVRLSARKSFSGLIVPLSIAYSSSKEFMNLRQFIEVDQSSWRFAFFDRSPDSLFGDDVKTRASIIFRSASDEYNRSIKTTKLNRWNSINRDSLFENITFSNNIPYSIQYEIPKIQTDLEIKVLNILKSSKSRLGKSFKTVSKDRLLYNSNNDNYLYFSNTGYNWIPVFLEPPISWDKNGNEIISSSIWAVECKFNKYLLYSLVTSTISYWLWIVHGDIFHLSKKFVDSLPYDQDSFSKEATEALTKLGESLWNEVKQNKIYKNNAGKKIGNYTYIQSQKTIYEINQIIIRELNLPSTFDISLKKWYHYMLSAGRDSFKYSEHLELDENDITMEE